MVLCCKHASHSPIPGGGLKITLMLTFRSLRYNTHQKIKYIMSKVYCDDHEPDNVES